MNTLQKITGSAFALALVLGISIPSADAANVVDVAVDNDLTTLVDFVVAADLAPTVAGLSDATVFAPTNKAFDKLPNVLLRAIENDPEILQSILLYHVVTTDELKAEDVVELRKISPAYPGQDIRVRSGGSNVFLDASRVIATDVEADNNVTVHVIDRVMVPWRGIIRDVISALRH